MVRGMFAVSAALVGFASVSSAYATTPSFDCTPVVYAFRHAEDGPPVAPSACLPDSKVKCTTALTSSGMMHANLYVEMVTNLEKTEDFCPVKYVVAVNPINPDGFGGTTNPFKTGKPLSNIVMNLDPTVEVGGDRIDQNLKVVAPATMKSLVIGMTKSGASAAVFWTSEGLHALGLALGTDVIPAKTDTVSPPRNAAYIFRYNGGPNLIPPAKAAEFVQCFNYAKGNKAADNFSNKFFCGDGTNGNLSVPEADFAKLHGRICNRTAADFKKTTSPVGYYGYCESPPTGSKP
jgi:hypothetical protein